MIEELIKIDQQLFHVINTASSNTFFDCLMPILRNKYTWIPLYIIIIGFALKTFKLKGLYFLIFLAAAAGMADYGSASVLKPTFNNGKFQAK